ncbi:MAG: molecular chaperone [Desulfobacteraceae bacterium]|nr:MAG: molecular chaperone [Desulfobacteraceae bacterium]
MTNTATQTAKDVFLKTRTDTYALLAALLNQAPDADLLSQLQHIEWHASLPQRLINAWIGLRNAANTYPEHLIEKEFQSVFVGLGQGEVVPYASWYLEGLLMALPLARLRLDLIKLGITRRAEVHEPEDHAGLLCQTMALLGQRSDIPLQEYARFFDAHLASWMFDFFIDVQKAPHAGFYRSVAELGLFLLEWEQNYLSEHGPAKVH